LRLLPPTSSNLFVMPPSALPKCNLPQPPCPHLDSLWHHHVILFGSTGMGLKP
jgi:hypothetical protein